MKLRIGLISTAFAGLFGGAALAQEVNFPAVPAPLPPDRSAGFVVPTPNSGFIAGGSTANGQGGIITHQPLGGGFSTTGGTYGSGSGTSYGGSILTGPSGPVGGTVTFGTTF